jgi:hypothetical protein
MYDVFALLRTYPGGPEAFPRELRLVRSTEDVELALDGLSAMFERDTDVGPRLVADARSAEPGDPEAYVTEARVTVQRFLRAMRTR